MKYLFLVLIISNASASAKSYSPFIEQKYPENVFWGDTHLHSFLSGDAYSMGNRISPDEAYRFAKGETIKATGGDKVRIRKALDFMMVADHAENLGVLPALVAGNPKLMATEQGRESASFLKQLPSLESILRSKSEKEYNVGANKLLGAKSTHGKNYNVDEAFTRQVWKGVVAIAERHNDPGKFTTFAGYEYSSSGLHRNVIYGGSPEDTLKTIPFSRFDSDNPEDLWAYLEKYREQTGSGVISIPHNSNLSRGNMFKTVTYEGKKISLNYIQTRASIEPLVEITQIKGDSETHPLISPNDEFADYERHGNAGSRGSLSETKQIKEYCDSYYAGQAQGLPSDSRVEAFCEKQRGSNSKDNPSDTQALIRGSYVRSALQRGLAIQASIGANPYKFGIIGATDTHTGIATVDEDNYWGKMAMNEPSPYRANTQSHYSAQGYAAVWAIENTRDAIFAAMERREVYATTGPRITLRFFGGWDYLSADADSPDLAQIGYSRGVPMGGDLVQSKENKATGPTFLIRATKDPDGANLDRIQIVKSWLDENQSTNEKIYNVAWSGKREINGDGGLAAVGSTVNLREASYQNTIGSPELSVTWRDEDFNHSEAAVYYVRVLQIPTPRWTTYDAKTYGLEDIQTKPPAIIQERAYSSPIWYSPQ